MAVLGILSVLGFAIAAILLLVGMIRPGWALWWGDPVKRTRKRVWKIYGIAAPVCLILFSLAAKQHSLSAKARSGGAAVSQEAALSGRALIKNPEYQSWKAFSDDHIALIRESNRRFGVAPHDGLRRGQKLKIEKASFLVPWPGAGGRRPAVRDGSFIEKAVTLQPGETVEIVDRLLRPGGTTAWYLVKVPGRNNAYGYFNPVVLTWYDTPERDEAHYKKVQAWREPRYQALKEKHFAAKGLDQSKVDAMAAKGKWGQIAGAYGD